MAKDLVCAMKVDEKKAAATSTHILRSAFKCLVFPIRKVTVDFAVEEFDAISQPFTCASF